MRLAYFGTANFAVPSLVAVADSAVLCVSQPARPTGRGLKLQPSPVAAKAAELDICCSTPEKCRDPEFVRSIVDLDLDLIVVAAYGQILPRSLLDAARRGAVNLHGSLLPKYRGAAPVQHALLNGETETGVTLMQMDVGMDTGDMIDVLRMGVPEEMTAGECLVALGDLAALLIAKWLPRIESGQYPRTPQDDEAASMAPKLISKDGHLISKLSAREAMNRFRAMTPAPGAHVATILGRLKIHAAKPIETTLEPGKCAVIGGNLVAGFADGGLILQTVQLDGRPRVDGVAFANGARIDPDKRFFE